MYTWKTKLDDQQTGKGDAEATFWRIAVISRKYIFHFIFQQQSGLICNWKFAVSSKDISRNPCPQTFNCKDARWHAVLTVLIFSESCWKSHWNIMKWNSNPYWFLLEDNFVKQLKVVTQFSKCQNIERRVVPAILGQVENTEFLLASLSNPHRPMHHTSLIHCRLLPKAKLQQEW